MNQSLEVFEEHLKKSQRLHVQQVYEKFEIILNWETRNKYKILDENQQPVAYAAEQSEGLSGLLLRQFFGHWKPFKIIIFDQQKQPLYELHSPFRWLFKTFFVKKTTGEELGHLQQRFAIFRKKFDLKDKNGRTIGRINSPFFKFWTFEVHFGRKKLGTIQKKWTGVLAEYFTDMDNFIVSYADPNLDAKTKAMILSTCLMVDIVYFENNQGKRRFRLFD